MLLIVTYLLSASANATSVGVARLALFVITGRLALRASRLGRRASRILLGVAVAGSAAAAGLAFTRPDDAAVTAASVWTGLLLLVTIVLILGRILAFPRVTAQSIYGAVSAYLLIGLMFASFYAAISQARGGHFFAHGQPGSTQTFQYFSFTTLTTLGYGDFTAAGNDGRALAVIEALTGQVFLATLVARLVAAFRGPTGTWDRDGPAPPAGAGPAAERGRRTGPRQRGGPGQLARQPKWRRGRPARGGRDDPGGPGKRRSC